MQIPFKKPYFKKSKLFAILNKALNNDAFIIIISCALFLLVEIPILTDSRPIQCDEAWYSNSAYNFSQGQGIQNTNVGSGGDSNLIFPLIQGILFVIFGYSIFMARFASVLAGLFSIIVLFKLLKQLKLPNNEIIFGIFALIAIPSYHSVFRYARPESWAILFVLLSLLFFIKYIHTFADSSLMFSGVFCGFGFLTHPFTLSISFAIGLILFYQFLKNKRILHLIAFAIPIIISLAIFVFNLVYLLNQLTLNSVFKRVNMADASFFNRIGNNFKYILNYYIMNKNAVYFVPLLFLLLAGLFIKKKNPFAFYSSLMGCLVFCISLILFTSSVFGYLLYYVLIFPILNIAFMVNSKTSKAILVAISVYLTIMLFANLYYDIKQYEPVSSLLAKDLPLIIPENAKVMGPIEFWMFIPETQYKANNYRWNDEVDLKQLPAKFEYFLFTEFANNISQHYYNINQGFKQHSGSKFIYETYSKKWGKIELYSLKR